MVRKFTNHFDIQPGYDMRSNQKKTKSYNVTILKLFETILSLNEHQQSELLCLAQNMAYGESRRANRKTCTVPINYLVDDQLYTDLIKNISRTGVYVETGKKVPVGAKIIMSFSLQDSKKPLKVEGKIIWCDLRGFGATFTSLTSYQEEMLGVIIERMDNAVG